MPNKTKINTIYSGLTTIIEKGQVALQEAIIKIPPKPLFVLFAYGGSGALAFKLAAYYKKRRLQKKYPEAEIRVIEGFEYSPQFKAEWTRLYNELTKPETANKYSLWQIHYFGHGGPEKLNFRGEEGENKINFNENDNMERLPWHPHEGIFVLHSCRGGAYEDTGNKYKIDKQICLARIISKQQKTRCLGQTIYANNAIDAIKIDNYSPDANLYSFAFEPETTAEEDAERFKYRPNRLINSFFSYYPIDRVLWGYALLTGDTKKKSLDMKTKYEELMLEEGIKNATYPIYEEIKKLGPKNQILPCRVFNNGVLEERIVEVDVFNQNDLEYI